MQAINHKRSCSPQIACNTEFSVLCVNKDNNILNNLTTSNLWGLGVAKHLPFSNFSSGSCCPKGIDKGSCVPSDISKFSSFSYCCASVLGLSGSVCSRNNTRGIVSLIHFKGSFKMCQNAVCILNNVHKVKRTSAPQSLVLYHNCTGAHRWHASVHATPAAWPVLSSRPWK